MCAGCFGRSRGMRAKVPGRLRICTSLSSWGGAWRAVDWDYAGQTPHPVSAYLLAHARPEDAVWREDGARVLLETDLRAGSRVPLTFLFTNHDDAPSEFGRMILSDFERTRPRYI